MLIKGAQIVLGVSGSIAAYKAADLASKLVQAGAIVDVIMTDAAQEFVSPLTFRSITGRPVFTNMFEPSSDLAEEHVSLARRADLVLVAPATATTMAKIAHGIADDLVALTVLATTAPVLLAPAMDAQMWENEATQTNMQLLLQRGLHKVGPEAGRLASGLSGAGRLANPEMIVAAVKQLLALDGDLSGQRIVVSAGGTREPIDPVRFISNRSSGKMGYALAEAARDRGASVVLVSTVSDLPVVYGAQLVPVSTVAEMRQAVLDASRNAGALIMAAAVSDYRPAKIADNKIKKGEGGMSLDLVKIDDFFHEVPDSVIKVAFAAETEELIANARRKFESHGHPDLICANDVSQPDAGFGVDTNRVTILDPDGGIEALPLMSKYDVAHRILDRLVPLLATRRA